MFVPDYLSLAHTTNSRSASHRRVLNDVDLKSKANDVDLESKANDVDLKSKLK